MNINNIFPFLNWLPNYKKEWFLGDLGAGLTVGVLLIPQGIAYAMIAGLPPIYGLYTAMIPQLVYAFFGTSRQVSIGPVAMDSLIVASGVAALAEIGTQNFIEFAILLSLIMGALQVVFGVFKLGFLVNFLSRPVISGFTSAAAVIIALNQFKNLLGIDIQRNNRIQYLLLDTIDKIKDIGWITPLIGFISIIILFVFKKFAKKIPASLIVVILGILLVKFFKLDAVGLDIVGTIPKGLPLFKIPHFTIALVKDLFPVALTLAFIGFLEAISISKAVQLEEKNTFYKVKPNNEFIAIGLGNVVGSFFQAYPSTASLSRTAINAEVGAKTPFSSLISAFVVAITLLFLTPIFYYLPKAILAAIIIVSVLGLIDFKLPKQLLKTSKAEWVILMITLLTTVSIGIKEGVLTGVVISVIMLIYRSTKPHIAVLGRVPNTHFYRNLKRFDGLDDKEELLIVRFDSQLYFANVQYFIDKIEEYTSEKGEKLEQIIIDGESINNVDISAIYTLKEIVDKYKKQQINIVFTGLKGPVRDMMELSGIISEIGYDSCFMSVQNAVDAFYNEKENKNIEQKYFSYIKQTNCN